MGGSIWCASATVTLALYGVVMAVDGVALKQAVNAWVNAPDAQSSSVTSSSRKMATTVTRPIVPTNDRPNVYSAILPSRRRR
jgi:hypothetical protein